MINYKICKKGTGKAKNYKGCNKSIPKIKYDKPNFKYGLGISCGCYTKWLLDTSEGKKILEKSKLLGKKIADKNKKLENKNKKLENKTIASCIQEARKPFQKLIRIRDHGKKCICCNKQMPFNISDYDAGHFFKAELYIGLIFHPDNVFAQLKYCNKYGHGNENGFRDGLIERIGVEKYNKLNEIKNKLKSYKFSKEQLIVMKDYYNKQLKLVEKGLKNINDVDFSIGIINNIL